MEKTSSVLSEAFYAPRHVPIFAPIVELPGSILIGLLSLPHLEVAVKGTFPYRSRKGVFSQDHLYSSPLRFFSQAKSSLNSDLKFDLDFIRSPYGGTVVGSIQMATDLSVAANAFAVVGLADVAFRYGRELVELVVKLKQTDQDVDNLLVELRILASLLARVRILVEDSRTSSVTQQNQGAWIELELIIKGCQNEFSLLQEILAVAQAPVAGWLGQSRRKANWVLKDSRLTQSFERLQRHETQLVTTLSVLGGYVNESLIEDWNQRFDFSPGRTKSC